MKNFIKSLGLIVFLFPALQLHAQERVIKGKVTDSNDKPLIGVIVGVKGTQNGTYTNNDGHYKIQIKKKNAVLIFSFIGYQQVTIKTKSYNKNTINVTLRQKTIGLNAITVFGYNQIESSHVASSVAEVNMNQIHTKNFTKMQQALSGTVPGVVMTQTSNFPGDVPGTIHIRGISSLENTSPLVLVDGIEESLTDLDPDNIQSITVLKDAASAALYGARGANGVIIVKTKRAKANQFKMQLNSSVSFHDPIRQPHFVNSANFMKLRNEAKKLQGEAIPFSQHQIEMAEKGEWGSVNWLDKIEQQRAYNQNSQVNIMGGGDVGTFALMLGFKSDQGMDPFQGQEMFTARFNTNINVSNGFTLLADFYARRLKVNSLHAQSRNDIFAAAWRMQPTDSVFYPGSKNHYQLHNGEINPVAAINVGGQAHSLYDRITLNLRPRYKINDNVSLRGNVSYMVNKSASKYKRSTYKFVNQKGKPVKFWENAVGSSQGVSVSQFTTRGLVNYASNFRKGKDKLNLIVGTEAMLHTFTNFKEYSRASFFTKMNYSLANDRYEFMASMRADGSSKFAPGHRWGYFPSGAFAWNVTNEGFMSGITATGTLTKMKLRFSYGYVGNENVAPYLWEPIVNNWGWSIRIPNPEFTWEKQNQGDIGIDLTMLNQRLNITADAYRKHSFDLIFGSYPVPPLTGSNSLESAVNIGAVKNEGWEFSAGWSDHIGRSFSYTISGMVFNNENKVLKAGPTKSDTLVFKGNPDKIWYRGISMNNYYGFETSGYYQSKKEIKDTKAKFPHTQVGDIKYIDQNNDGTLNTRDRINLGDMDPHFNYAIHINLSYKRWNFKASGTGVGRRLGRLGGLEGYPVLMDGQTDSYGTPRRYYMKHRWTPENRHSRFPRVWTGASPNAKLSNVWLSNAAYFRVTLLEIGYTFPVVGKNIKNLRLYINAQDPFLFTPWEGLDPERNGGNGQYPRMRGITFGVNATIF
jgi:TonB-linked SusC/RagA family outer membrane protein